MKKIAKNKFILKPGQVDFTNIRWAPVINCVLKYKDKILLLQRSGKSNFYPNYWSGISGFLDDNKSLKEKVEEELREEVGINKNRIKKINLGRVFDQEAPKYQKTWIVHPVLVEVSTDKLKTDWESRSFRWLKLNDTKKLKLLPGFEEVLKNLL